MHKNHLSQRSRANTWRQENTHLYINNNITNSFYRGCGIRSNGVVSLPGFPIFGNLSSCFLYAMPCNAVYSRDMPSANL